MTHYTTIADESEKFKNKLFIQYSAIKDSHYIRASQKLIDKFYKYSAGKTVQEIKEICVPHESGYLNFPTEVFNETNTM